MIVSGYIPIIPTIKMDIEIDKDMNETSIGIAPRRNTNIPLILTRKRSNTVTPLFTIQPPSSPSPLITPYQSHFTPNKPVEVFERQREPERILSPLNKKPYCPFSDYSEEEDDYIMPTETRLALEAKKAKELEENEKFELKTSHDTNTDSYYSEPESDTFIMDPPKPEIPPEERPIDIGISSSSSYDDFSESSFDNQYSESFNKSTEEMKLGASRSDSRKHNVFASADSFIFTESAFEPFQSPQIIPAKSLEPLSPIADLSPLDILDIGQGEEAEDRLMQEFRVRDAELNYKMLKQKWETKIDDERKNATIREQQLIAKHYLELKQNNTPAVLARQEEERKSLEEENEKLIEMLLARMEKELEKPKQKLKALSNGESFGGSGPIELPPSIPKIMPPERASTARTRPRRNTGLPYRVLLPPI